MSRTLQTFICAVVALSTTVAARGDVKTQAVRETTEFVIRKFSKEAAEEGTELLAKRIEGLAAKHGDEALEAVRKVGPRALKYADDAGEHGAAAVQAMAKYGDDGVEFIARNPQALQLTAKYGDDAAAAIVKHKGAVTPLVEQFGKPAAAALKAVDGEAGRRLAIMAADGQLKQIGRTDALLGVVSKYGNKAVDFIWNNKGGLAVAAGLAAFLANPEPFLNGTADLAQVVGENVVKPLVQIPGQIAGEAAARVDWTVAVIVIVAAVALASVWRSYLRHRAELRRVAVKS